MPWKVSDPVSERLDFIRRLEAGERVVDLCRDFGISRKTAYKLKDRYEQFGSRGLFDLSRAPKSIPHKTSPETEELLVNTRKQHPTWGPKKLRAVLLRKDPNVLLPCNSTVGAILARHGLVTARKRRRCDIPRAPPLHTAAAPNDIWCADFKGEFQLLTRAYCYPLTITDRFSRYILKCDGLESTHVETAITVFDDAFREFGLPLVLRTDNGVPFASQGLCGLTRLSARWLRLGIWPERIQPGHPEQNGQHERMHLVLKRETTRPAARNFLQQQERFDAFTHEYNFERPHEAIGQRPPADIFQPSARPFPEKLPDPEYPLHDVVGQVTACGHVQLGNKRFYLTTALAGELVGMREVEDGRWLVSFVNLDLGHYDSKQKHFTPAVPEEQGSSQDPMQ